MKRATGLVLVMALALAACQGGGDAAQGVALEGVLGVDAGQCSDGEVETGSWFRMVQPDGDPEAGPFVPNVDSPCGDATWTPLAPGSDGGIRLGAYQEQPDPVFDDGGHGLASAILEPTAFFAVMFSVATNPTDPQTGLPVAAPSLRADESGALEGDLSALGVAWNGQHFNQGVPKPDGSTPGHTAGPTGTYDADTGAYTLTWRSKIVGGPFDNFTGVWHLEGTLSG